MNEDVEFIGREEVLRRATIRDRIAYWQRRLGLQDWDIRYYPLGNPSPKYFATVASRLQEKVAQVEIAPDLPLSQIDVTIVHELLHVVAKRYAEMVDRVVALIPDTEGVNTRDMVADILEDLEEQYIDAIARAMTGQRFYPTGDLVDDYQEFAA